MVDFQDRSNLKKGQDSQPWSFDSYLLCITSFNRNLVPQYLPFNKEFFWIQFHQLLLGMMNYKYGKFIKKILGEVKEFYIRMELGGVLSSGSGFGLISPSPC